MTNHEKRLARLQRECNVSAVPAMLMCAACVVLVFVLAMNAVLDEAPPARAEDPTPQATAPAA